jgi:hypothetical protein
MVRDVFIPLHINYETNRTKGMNIFQRYWENSIRNPTPYWRDKFKQPIPEDHPNPDHIVRSEGGVAAVRVMRHEIYIEKWTLKRLKKPWFGRPYFEKRKGWKFVDNDDDGDTFWPTYQWGPRK